MSMLHLKEAYHVRNKRKKEGRFSISAVKVNLNGSPSRG